jgi:hypothetical protein
MKIAPILDRTAAVLVGNLNPAIFTPAWFQLNGVISPEDAAGATVHVIHPELAQFDMGVFNIMVDTQKFMVSCTTTHHEMTRDLIIATFGAVLMHTPISAIGINREIHFDTGDFWVRNAVGDQLAPKGAWGDWASELDNTGKSPTQAGGLASMTMRQARLGEIPGYILATIQPSQLPQLREQGIYIGINNHYDLNGVNKAGSETGVDKLIWAIETDWSSALTKSEFICDQIQTLVQKSQREARK